MKRRILSFILAVCIALGISPAAFATSINDSTMFFKQSTSSTCTLASSAMMLRRRALIDGLGDWSSITEANLRGTAWISGAGLRNSFTYKGMSVKNQGLISAGYNTVQKKKDYFISLLSQHPEGIVAYNIKNGGQYHAVLMTDYDASSGTFYCADPSSKAAAGRIAFGNSSIYGSGQDGKFGSINSIWYISNKSGGSDPSTPSVPVGTTSKPEVSVNGQTVNVSWSYSGSGTSIDVYIIVSPWDWSGIRYKQNVTGNSCTFTDVAPGYYNVFTVAQPNNRQVQSDWAEFTVQEPHTTHEKGEFRYSGSEHPHYNYYTCSICGEVFTDGSTSINYSCTQCHPEHTKGEFRYSASDHPHYNYYTCTVCGSEFTDGSTTVNYSCSQCHPEHIKGDFCYTATEHPHNNYYVCTVCGKEFTDGSSTPDNNCLQCHWSHIWDAGEITVKPTIHEPGEMTYTCSICGEKRIETLPIKSTSFEDVKSDAFYADAVEWAVDSNITSGISETKFGPNNPCTRGQIVTFLWRAAGSPQPKTVSCRFVDIKPGDYFYKAVLWAVENKITSGTDETHFSPNTHCTRAQAITFIWRSEGKPEAERKAPFSDVSPKSYYANAVNWGVEYGVTSGVGNNKFGSNDACTRGQIVTFIYRGTK